MAKRAAIESFYDYVIGSERWARLRARLIAARGRRCEDCGVSYVRRDLDLHHLTYDRLGDERDTDLKVLCRRCHYQADRDREEIALYRARLHGWAAKRYGDLWWWEQDQFAVQAAFDDWLERQDR